jgi:hypothetical protein
MADVRVVLDTRTSPYTWVELSTAINPSLVRHSCTPSSNHDLKSYERIMTIDGLGNYSLQFIDKSKIPIKPDDFTLILDTRRSFIWAKVLKTNIPSLVRFDCVPPDYKNYAQVLTINENGIFHNRSYHWSELSEWSERYDLSELFEWSQLSEWSESSDWDKWCKWSKKTDTQIPPKPTDLTNLKQVILCQNDMKYKLV